MADRLGYRLKLGVLVPAFNTSVQPELEGMRPRGVTNHVARIEMPDGALTNDDEQAAVIDQLGADLFGALRRVMLCRPHAVIMGISIPTFWGGPAGAHAMKAQLEAAASVPVILGSEACIAALARFPQVKTIGIVTPYQKVGDEHVRQFFEASGYAVSSVRSLRPASSGGIAAVEEAALIPALRAARDGADAVLQVGTNLAAADLIDEAERTLDIPVISINAALYWLALRSQNIADRINGFGSLLREF